MKTILLFLIAIIMSGSVKAGEIMPMEKKILDEVNGSIEEAIALLAETVNINSGTMNHEGVRQVGEIFAREFEKIGFDTTWIPMASVDRSGHLFAQRQGTEGKRVLLIGHLDTVFEKDNAFQPFERKGSRALGQGVNDMKGGDVIIFYALKALHQAGALENRSIIVAFTGDEEMPGDPISISRKDLIDAAKKSDVALGFESAEGLNTGTIARRGIEEWVLEVSGAQGHSSLIFNEEYGSGAVFEAARILNEFHQQLKGEQFLTFNPAVMLAGTEVTYDEELSKGTAFSKTNVIPRKAVVNGDLRFISEEQKQKARDRMRQIVSKNHPKTSARIRFKGSYPAMAPTEGNMKVLRLLDTVSRDLGYQPIEPFDPGARGAADISFIAPYVDCLDGLGAMGIGGHTPEEDIDLKALPILIQRAAILIYRLTQLPRGRM